MHCVVALGWDQDFSSPSPNRVGEEPIPGLLQQALWPMFLLLAVDWGPLSCVDTLDSVADWSCTGLDSSLLLTRTMTVCRATIIVNIVTYSPVWQIASINKHHYALFQYTNAVHHQNHSHTTHTTRTVLLMDRMPVQKCIIRLQSTSLHDNVFGASWEFRDWSLHSNELLNNTNNNSNIFLTIIYLLICRLYVGVLVSLSFQSNRPTRCDNSPGIDLNHEVPGDLVIL